MDKIFTLIDQQQQQLDKTINLIASENLSTDAVRAATGSVLSDKYAEGYPGRRYYSGCNIVDEIERIAIDRACKLFGAEHANVQPHAGSTANFAVYQALIKPGDKVLAMDLAAGGHLTHGHKLNFSGKLYSFIGYGVDPKTGLIDYEVVRQLAREHKPKIIVAGASAYSRIIDFAKFADIAREVGAYFMADMAHIAGLVAAGIHPSPVPYADVVTTTTHKTLRGPRGGLILCKREHAALIDRTVMPGIQGGPFLHSIAAKAVAFEEALQPEFKVYAQEIVQNMKALTKALVVRGYQAVSGGTDNHLVVIDLRNKGIKGNVAEEKLAALGIFVNRNCIPFDPEPPLVTSGIRLGTAQITTRGLAEADMQDIANIIADCLESKAADDDLAGRISHLVARYK